LHVVAVSTTDFGFSGGVPPRAEAEFVNSTTNEARERRASERHGVGC